MPDLGIANIRNFQIPLPSINEQEQIVSYFEKLQKQINALKKVQTETKMKMEELVPSILDKAFKGEL